MKAAVLTGQGFEIRERETPECGPGEILIKSIACGICEGDVHRYRTALGKAGFEDVIGHEGSGTVAAVGPGVEEISLGDRVTCLDGPYGEYFITRPERVVPLPEEIDPVWAMGEPVACVMHAARRFGIELGDRVAVLGCGFMGLCCLQTALLRGPSFLCAIDPIPWRLETAREMRADAVHALGDESGEDLLRELGEFDVVIEAAGTPSAIDLATHLVRQHGRIVLIGYHQSEGGMRTVNMERWNFKAIDVINGHVRRDDEKLEAMRAGIELMRTGRIDMASLVTPYPLDRIQDAFQGLIDRRKGLYKVALTPS